MADFEGMFKATSRKTKTATVCLDGALTKEFDALEDELKAARESDTKTFAGGEERKVVERMDAIRAKMTEAEVTFEFVQLDPMRPLDLIAEHPPREGNKIDAALGYNQETYYRALVRESCATVTSHDGTTAAADDIADDAWQSMLDIKTGLGHADLDVLVGAAMEANGRTSVPFSRLASLISTRSEAASKPRKRGTSPRSGSKAGSPASRPSTPTTTLEGSSAP